MKIFEFKEDGFVDDGRASKDLCEGKHGTDFRESGQDGGQGRPLCCGCSPPAWN